MFIFNNSVIDFYIIVIFFINSNYFIIDKAINYIYINIFAI